MVAPSVRRALTVAVLTVAPVLAVAQEGPSPQLLLIHQEKVHPSMIEEYRQASRDFNAQVESHREAMPTFHTLAFRTDEMEYAFVVPIANFAELDTMMGEFMAMEAAGGDAWREVMRRSGSTVLRHEETVVVHRPDLSYAPATPRLRPEEVKAHRWDFYYLRPDRVHEAEALSRDIAALYRAKGITDGFGVYQQVIGPDLPLFVVVTNGKDAADLYSREQAIGATLGAEWAPFEARIMEVSRDFRSKMAWPEPELSLAAPATQE